MKIAKMSPQKKYKLKPILITLKTTFWIIRQVLFEVWCNFKYYFILFAALRPTLCFSSSTFSYHFVCSFFEQWNISRDICDCLPWLTSFYNITNLPDTPGSNETDFWLSLLSPFAHKFNFTARLFSNSKQPFTDVL